MWLSPVFVSWLCHNQHRPGISWDETVLSSGKAEPHCNPRCSMKWPAHSSRSVPCLNRHNFIAWQHKPQTQNWSYNRSFFLTYCVCTSLSTLPLPEATRVGEGALGSENKPKHQGVDERLPPTTAKIPVFIGLACSLMSCKAELTEAWGCWYYSGCCCKGTSQEINFPGEEQQGCHARKQTDASEPQNCFVPISFLQKVNEPK